MFTHLIQAEDSHSSHLFELFWHCSSDMTIQFNDTANCALCKAFSPCAVKFGIIESWLKLRCITCTSGVAQIGKWNYICRHSEWVGDAQSWAVLSVWQSSFNLIQYLCNLRHLIVRSFILSSVALLKTLQYYTITENYKIINVLNLCLT